MTITDFFHVQYEVQKVKSSPKVWDFNEKRLLHWASVVRENKETVMVAILI